MLSGRLDRFDHPGVLDEAFITCEVDDDRTLSSRIWGRKLWPIMTKDANTTNRSGREATRGTAYVISALSPGCRSRIGLVFMRRFVLVEFDS